MGVHQLSMEPMWLLQDFQYVYAAFRLENQQHGQVQKFNQSA